MQVGLWKRSMLVMLEIMDVLSANPNIILDDTADASEERTAEPEPNEKGEIRVWGNLVAFVERLDDEMFKSLQVMLCVCLSACHDVGHEGMETAAILLSLNLQQTATQ